jgi:hypothetical protein
MNKQDTEEVVLTTEQRRQLGPLYRLILSWRRERKNKIEKLSEHELPECEGQFEQINPESVGLIESRS